MDMEANKAKRKWYQMPRFQLTGDYMGGVMEGLGLGIMLVAGVMTSNYKLPPLETIFAAGAVITVTGALVTACMQGRHDKVHDEEDG